MAKQPVAVTAREWKSAKPMTLKDPGLDKKLIAWEAAKKELDAKPSIGGVDKCAKALKEVVTMARTAQSKCNKTLHKDGIAFLGGYTAAVAKISNAMQKDAEDYMKKVKAWSQKRVDCLAGIKKLQPKFDKLDKKIELSMKTCEASVKANKYVDKSVRLAETLLKEIAEFRKDAQSAIDIVRIDDPNTRIHVDDRGQKYIDMFTQSIQLQSSFEGGCIRHINWLEKFSKKNKG